MHQVHRSIEVVDHLRVVHTLRVLFEKSPEKDKQPEDELMSSTQEVKEIRKKDDEDMRINKSIEIEIETLGDNKVIKSLRYNN